MLRIAVVALAIANLAMLALAQGWLDPWLDAQGLASPSQRQPQRLARQVAPQAMVLLPATPGASATTTHDGGSSSRVTAPPVPADGGASAASTASTVDRAVSAASSAADLGASAGTPGLGTAAAAAATADGGAPGCQQTTLLPPDAADAVQRALKAAGLAATRLASPPVGTQWVIVGPLDEAAMARTRAQLVKLKREFREVRGGDELPARWRPALLVSRLDDADKAQALRDRLRDGGLDKARVVEVETPPLQRLRISPLPADARATLAAIELPDGAAWLGCRAADAATASAKATRR